MAHLEAVYVEILATPAIEDIEDIATMCPLFLSNIDGSISLFIYITKIITLSTIVFLNMFFYELKI